VDHPARRIARADHLSERRGIGGDVSGLSLIGEKRAPNNLPMTHVIFLLKFLTEP
jgi:hypothetical protein